MLTHVHVPVQWNHEPQVDFSPVILLRIFRATRFFKSFQIEWFFFNQLPFPLGVQKSGVYCTVCTVKVYPFCYATLTSLLVKRNKSSMLLLWTVHLILEKLEFAVH